VGALQEYLISFSGTVIKVVYESIGNLLSGKDYNNQI
jgi:hypothetical protein